MSGLSPATLGSSANLQVGQQVVAVGSPLGPVRDGDLRHRVRAEPAGPHRQDQQPGPGSGRARSSQSTARPPCSTRSRPTRRSTRATPAARWSTWTARSSASTRPSPRCPAASRQSGSIGVGFAIPIDQAHRIAQEIINTGKATHAVLGASVGEHRLGRPELGAAAAGLSTGAKIARSPPAAARPRRACRPATSSPRSATMPVELGGRADRRHPVAEPGRQGELTTSAGPRPRPSPSLSGRPPRTDPRRGPARQIGPRHRIGPVTASPIAREPHTRPGSASRARTRGADPS